MLLWNILPQPVHQPWTLPTGRLTPPLRLFPSSHFHSLVQIFAGWFLPCPCFFLFPVFLLHFPARWSMSTQLCPSCLDPQIRPHFPSLQATNISHVTPMKQSGAQLIHLLKCLLFSPRYPYSPSYTRLRHRLIFL